MNTNVNVKDYDLLCTLISAIEGGSNYWCSNVKGYRAIFNCTKVPYTTPNKTDVEGENFRKWYESGGSLTITEDDSHKFGHDGVWTFDKAAIEKGISIMANKYPRHFANMVNENGDAETGDVFLQCCLFGEIVYG